MDNGLSVWNGWLSPDPDDFRVPQADYVDKVLAAVKKCDHCKGKNAHKMLPEGFYIPKSNEDLFDLVRRFPVEIRTWTILPDDEED